MQERNKRPIIYSPHRPFFKHLNAVKWVCLFSKKIEDENIEISNSRYYTEFFFYLINKLQIEYQKHTDIIDLEGRPKRDVVVNIVNIFNGESLYKEELLKKSLSKRMTKSDKNIYSTYKASSYYINLAKDKFRLLDKNNKLTEKGKELVSLKSDFFSLSEKEKSFIFERLLYADFFLLIPFCFALKSKFKKQVDLNATHVHFIEYKYNINHFKTAKESLRRNYDNVRQSWVSNLGILDKKFNITKKYIRIITENEQYAMWYKELVNAYKDFEKDIFNVAIKEKNTFEKLETKYKELIALGKHDLGYVNVYDISKKMHFSFKRMQELLNNYYDKERKNKLILFSNTVIRIDSRQRFIVKNTPVIKIKIRIK